MTTAAFEKAAKLAVVRFQDDMYNHYITIDEVHVVWMCHLLGNKKCILIDSTNNRIYEVTYNCNAHEMYLDCYQKEHNEKISGELIDALVDETEPETPEWGGF